MTDHSTEETVTIPLVAERADVQVREVERGRTRIDIAVDEREAVAEALLRQEDVEVERVAIGRAVTEAPPVREEDGVMIVPILEERLVVRTELVVKEELRITRRQRVESVRVPVRLRVERAEVTRLENRDPDNPDGD